MWTSNSQENLGHQNSGAPPFFWGLFPLLRACLCWQCSDKIRKYQGHIETFKKKRENQTPYAGSWDLKNGHILPTGQWYTPSAVINNAWYCMVLHYLALSCTNLHHLAPSCTIFHHLEPSCIILHHLAQFCTILHHVAPSCTMLHHVTQCCTMLCHVSPCCTMLNHVAPC